MPFIPAIIGAAVDAISTVGTAIATGVATGAEAIGIPAAIAGPLGGAAEWGLGEGILGAGEAAITGGDPLKGFESGAIGGAFTGGFAPVLQGFGIGASMADAIAGAGGGALGAAATGRNPLSGAITGGVEGFVGGSLGGGRSAGGGGAAGGGGGAAIPVTGATTDAASLGVPTDTTGMITGAPTDSTLPGTVGAGAAAPSSATNISGPMPIDVTGGGPVSGIAGGAGDVGTTAAASGTARGGGFADFLKSPNALVLGADLLAGNRQPAYTGNVRGAASDLSGQGARLRSYLESGTLPPGLEAQLTAATESAKATERGFYAGHGMQGSSAEAEDLGNIALREQAQAAQIATQLFNEGLSESQIGAQLYMDLMNVQLRQDEEFSSSVADLAKAMGSMGQPITPAGA